MGEWVVHPLRPQVFHPPSRCPSGFVLGTSLWPREISWSSGCTLYIVQPNTSLLPAVYRYNVLHASWGKFDGKAIWTLMPILFSFHCSISFNPPFSLFMLLPLSVVGWRQLHQPHPNFSIVFHFCCWAALPSKHIYSSGTFHKKNINSFICVQSRMELTGQSLLILSSRFVFTNNSKSLRFLWWVFQERFSWSFFVLYVLQSYQFEWGDGGNVTPARRYILLFINFWKPLNP